VGYTPKNAKWYVADIVEHIIVEGDPRNVVHTNSVLVRADSPEEAYEKAMELGMGGEQSYENPGGQRVTFRFRGLRDLNVVHDELEHGAELTFSEDIGMDDSAIAEWVSSKEELSVFRPITPSKGPDYRSPDIVEEMHKRFPHLRSDDPASSEV
jgi:hypothetical protein